MSSDASTNRMLVDVVHEVDAVDDPNGNTKRIVLYSISLSLSLSLF
jgi:hypothetical protein